MKNSACIKVLCCSVTPSPYQRDLFTALAKEPDCQLNVVYFESAPGDSPWLNINLEPWEQILTGFTLGKGRVRSHINIGLPPLAQYDAVIVNAPISAVTTQMLFRRLNRSGTPWFFWGELLMQHAGWRSTLQRYLLHPIDSAQAIVAIGEKARADYQQRFPNLPVHNIPYSCNLEPYYPVPESQTESHETVKFLYAGQMIHRKGVDVLLEAFTGLIASGLKAELHLVGTPGTLETWLSETDDRTRSHIHYHGFKQPDELPKHFRNADVFILPSRHDGWGVVVNQALGAGLPVITTHSVGAGSELIKDGHNGYLVAPEASEPLQKAMTIICNEPETRHEMAASALKTSERLKPDDFAKKWLSVIQQSSETLQS